MNAGLLRDLLEMEAVADDRLAFIQFCLGFFPSRGNLPDGQGRG
jgi:hypothetical protein